MNVVVAFYFHIEFDISYINMQYQMNILLVITFLLLLTNVDVYASIEPIKTYKTIGTPFYVYSSEDRLFALAPWGIRSWNITNGEKLLDLLFKHENIKEIHQEFTYNEYLPSLHVFKEYLLYGYKNILIQWNITSGDVLKYRYLDGISHFFHDDKFYSYSKYEIQKYNLEDLSQEEFYPKCDDKNYFEYVYLTEDDDDEKFCIIHDMGDATYSSKVWNKNVTTILGDLGDLKWDKWYYPSIIYGNNNYFIFKSNKGIIYIWNYKDNYIKYYYFEPYFHSWTIKNFLYELVEHKYIDDSLIFKFTKFDLLTKKYISEYFLKTYYNQFYTSIHISKEYLFIAGNYGIIYQYKISNMTKFIF